MTRYCPKCRAEYQDWVEKCLDCNERLVGTKPSPAADIKEEPNIINRGGRHYSQEPIVVLTSFENYLEAEFIKGILESEGIAGMLVRADATFASKSGVYNNKRGIELQVKESELEKAREILESIDKNISEEDIMSTDNSGTEPPGR